MLYGYLQQNDDTNKLVGETNYLWKQADAREYLLYISLTLSTTHAYAASHKDGAYPWEKKGSD